MLHMGYPSCFFCMILLLHVFFVLEESLTVVQSPKQYRGGN
ncbi:hypothetical protein HanPSC8_Chr04g0136271 [Helianthus annuus]|nr:hypothetical protein HanPSC8_Chr04g0136271 [Helianthus annuus]